LNAKINKKCLQIAKICKEIGVKESNAGVKILTGSSQIAVSVHAHCAVKIWLKNHSKRWQIVQSF